MSEVLILAAGQGSKLWPYASTRNKATLPIGNVPLIVHTLKACQAAGVSRAVVVVERYAAHMTHLLKAYTWVDVVELTTSKGSADSFVQGMSHIKSDVVHVLFGDHYVPHDDLVAYLRQAKPHQVAVAPLREHPTNWIAAQVKAAELIYFGAHQRGNDMTHHMAALTLDRSFVAIAQKNPERFSDVKVGVGSPMEAFIEESLNTLIKAQGPMKTFELKEPFFDCDKPWHVLEANAYYAQRACAALSAHDLAEGASIDPSARVEGFVKLGKNSHIGRNVWVQGNLIVGEDSVIDHGAVIMDGVILGDNTKVLGGAKVHSLSVIGARNWLDQGFEFLGGLTMDHVYMMHYGEYYGMIGEHSDLGAGTTCGTLRFDDQANEHRVKGRKEVPLNFANASYLGDYTRTGVGALLMPGVKVGAYSVVGSGVVLNEDLEDQTLVYVQQTLKKVPWGTDKYGW